MNEEKAKNIFLILFIFLIIGSAIGAAIYTTYSPIKKLRNNDIQEANSYKKNNNIENKDEINVQEKPNMQEKNNSSSIVDTSNIEKEIASFSTTIYDTEEARIHNIQLAVSKLDGIIINPSDEFSFNETIGPMGEKEGYQKATGFNGNGKKIKIFGGGMCQISSTLYNAALIANFEVTERHAHSRRVYYVPKDKDATVSYGGADLKFINNSGKKIKISAVTDGHEVTIKLLQIEQ